MTEKRFDLITALYAVCCDYHSGQNSRGYRILSRIQSAYKPRNVPSLDDILESDEWIDCREIAERIIKNYVETDKL